MGEGEPFLRRFPLPQLPHPSLKLVPGIDLHRRERIKSSVLDNDFMIPAQEASMSCTACPPGGVSEPSPARAGFPQAIESSTGPPFPWIRAVPSAALPQGARALSPAGKGTACPRPRNGAGHTAPASRTPCPEPPWKKTRTSSGFTKVTGSFFASMPISSAKNRVRCMRKNIRRRNRGPSRCSRQARRESSSASDERKKGLLPLEKPGFRIGHEQRVVDQGNNGDAEQQRKGAYQQLPEIVGRDVRKIAYGQPRQHKGLFREILFPARKGKRNEEPRYPHHDDEFAEVRHQRVYEHVGNPGAADAEREDQHLPQRLVFAGHDADQAEHDGHLQKRRWIQGPEG